MQTCRRSNTWLMVSATVQVLRDSHWSCLTARITRWRSGKRLGMVSKGIARGQPRARTWCETPPTDSCKRMGGRTWARPLARVSNRSF